MNQQEFFDLHLEKLESFVIKQKNDLDLNTPDKIKDFISKSNYLSQLIIDKSDLLISEIFIENDLDLNYPVNFKGTVISLGQYLLLGVSSNFKKCWLDFHSFSDELFTRKFDS